MFKLIQYNIAVILKLVVLIIIVETATLTTTDEILLHTKTAQYIWAIVLYLLADYLETQSFKQD